MPEEMPMRMVAVMSFFVLLGCQSTPSSPSSQTTKLVEPASSTVATDAGEGICASAQWTDAMRCEDESCVAAAAGTQCVACVAETQRCIDERSSGCTERCVVCLGAERCEDLGNVTLASTHLTPTNHRGYTGSARVVHRVGQHPRGLVQAVTPDGLRLRATLGDPRRGWSDETELLLFDRDDRVLRRHISQCDFVGTPRGTWLLELCDGETWVVEGRTGFRREKVDVGEDELLDSAASFAGERWAIFRREDGWARLDLLSGEQRRLRIDDRASGVRLSPNGSRVAAAGRVRVWEIGDREKIVYAPDEIGDVEWLDDATLLIDGRDTLRVVTVPEGRLVREVPAPIRDIETPIRWRRFVSAPDYFFLGETPRSLKLRLGEGLDHDVELLDGDFSLDDLVSDRDRMLSAESVAAGLSDGSYFLTTVLGDVYWHPERGLQRRGALFGYALWWTTGGPGELLVGTTGSVVSIDIESGKATDLRLPADFRLIEARRSHGRLIAIGSKPGEHGPEYSRKILLRDESGTDRVIEHVADPVVATFDEAGALHVIDEHGLHTYDLSNAPKVVRSSKQPQGMRLLPGDEPPRALPSQGVFSPDGSLALFVPSLRNDRMFRGDEPPPPARLVRTADHKTLRTWNAVSCAFARRGTTYACAEPQANGHHEIVVYEEGKATWSLDVQLGSDITEVSDDGTRVILGDHMFRRSVDVVDLERARFERVETRGGPLMFLPDGRFISFDGTYVEVFDHVPAPALGE